MAVIPSAQPTSTESDHNTSAEQCIQFQRGKRYNELELNSKGQPKYSGDHMVWGSNALLTAVPGPRVFYSYWELPAGECYEECLSGGRPWGGYRGGGWVLAVTGGLGFTTARGARHRARVRGFGVGEGRR